MVASVWSQLLREAKELSEREPQIASLFRLFLSEKNSFGEALIALLASRLKSAGVFDQKALSELLSRVARAHPSIERSAATDLSAAFDRDPALEFLGETLFFGKGFHALQLYRFSHALWTSGELMTAKLIQSEVSYRFGVDIHPAAQIGSGVHIDHATGLVIGETAKVGNDVSIFHGVTLGGTGKESGDRHPKVGDGVLLSAHAQLLGNIRIGKGAKIGAGAVVLTDVPPHSTFAGVPAVKVGIPSCAAPGIEMNIDFLDAPDLQGARFYKKRR